MLSMMLVSSITKTVGYSHALSPFSSLPLRPGFTQAVLTSALTVLGQILDWTRVGSDTFVREVTLIRCLRARHSPYAMTRATPSAAAGHGHRVRVTAYAAFWCAMVTPSPFVTTVCTPVYSAKPSSAFSIPMPDCFRPPKATCGENV